MVAIEQALRRARIPFQSGLLAVEPPRFVFSVPRRRLADARAVLDPGAEAAPTADPAAEQRALFPWRPVLAIAALILVHLVLGTWVALAAGGTRLLEAGGLRPGGTALEPWRLLTSLLLHVDARHALWNGASTLIFGVPLLQCLGYRACAAVYLAAGVGGGLTSLAFSAPGTILVGSSGAVAGLFGAWIVVTLRLARLQESDWRARVRTLGIAMLVLPSLITPVTAAGRPISVSAHLGGLVTGMVVGALISSGLLLRALRMRKSDAECAT